MISLTIFFANLEFESTTQRVFQVILTRAIVRRFVKLTFDLCLLSMMNNVNICSQWHDGDAPVLTFLLFCRDIINLSLGELSLV